VAGGRLYFLKNRGNVFFTTSPIGDFDVVPWNGGALPAFTSLDLDPTITFSLKLGNISPESRFGPATASPKAICSPTASTPVFTLSPDRE
jgi:hypothetical protein